MTNSILAGAKSIGQRLFGGYAELLRIPHTARFSVGSVIACMPFPMVGMTITISVQHYYGNYSLAGALTAVQAIALAVASPMLGKLVDKFGQRQVSIPTIIVWMIAATALVSCITARVPSWILFCIVPFMAAIPPWGAMSRQRWTTLLKGDTEKTNRALSLSGVFDECMWVIGNPLASTLAVISGLLAFSFTGVCVVVGALMFLTELSTEPKSQTQLAREAGMTRKEYREREAARSKALQAEAAIEYARDRARSEGKTAAEVQAAMDQAAADVNAGRKESIWGPGLIAVCVTWFGLGAFQSAAGISIVAFATEANMKQYTGFVFACFSFSSLIGALVYGAKNWTIPLWKRFYFCLAVVDLGIGSFMFAKHLWVIMIIYLFIGVCQAPTWVNGNQLMLHLVPPTRFTEGMAWMGAMNSIGGSVGSAIAGQFIDRMGSHGGFIVVTALALTSLAIALFGFKQIKDSTEQPMLAREAGMTRKEYREREAARSKALQAEAAIEYARDRARSEGKTAAEVQAAMDQAAADVNAGRKESIWGPGLIAVCVTWFGLGAFQSAAGISIVAFATEANMKQYTGFVFACFSFSSLIGALVYGAKNWTIPLWKRFYFCLAVVDLGIGSFMFAKHLWVIMIIYLFIGVCQAPTWVNGNQLMLHLVPPTRFTEGMAWMGAMNSIGGSVGSAIAGQFIDRMGSHGGFIVVTALALTSLAIALFGFKQIKDSTEQPMLTTVSV